WNRPRIPLRSIGQIRRNAQLAFSTNLHPGDPFVPSLDDLPPAQQEVKRPPATDRTVELCAVGQPAGVVDFDVMSSLRARARAHFDVPVFKSAGGLGWLAGDLRGPAAARLFSRSSLVDHQAREC